MLFDNNAAESFYTLLVHFSTCARWGASWRVGTLRPWLELFSDDKMTRPAPEEVARYPPPWGLMCSTVGHR